MKSHLIFVPEKHEILIVEYCFNNLRRRGYKKANDKKVVLQHNNRTDCYLGLCLLRQSGPDFPGLL
jgi:hypothetical protein